MPNPTPQSVHVDALLTNMSIMYMQEAEGFVANEICPTLPVKKQSNKYAKWSKADWFRLQARKTGDADPAPIAGFRVDTSNSYFCEEESLKKLLTAQQKANYDVPLNADRATVNFLTQQMLMARDKRVLDALFVGSTWSTNYQGVSGTPSGAQFKQWDDSASTPFIDMRTIRTAVKKACGRRPNTLCVTSDVDDILQEHPDTLDKIKYTQTGIASNELLAKAFGVKKYVVADAVYNSAAENATATMAFFQTKKAILLYVPDAPSVDEPSAAYNFSWSEFDGLKAGTGVTIRSWEEKDPLGEWFRSGIHFDPKITAVDAGAYLYDVIA